MKKQSSTNELNKKQLETRCPMLHSLSILGNRWKPMILSHLMQGALRFSQLKTLLPSITQRMLTLSLRELESDNVITRADHGGYPKNVSYSLTNSGRRLKPVLKGIRKWGERHMIHANGNGELAEGPNSALRSKHIVLPMCSDANRSVQSN